MIKEHDYFLELMSNPTFSPKDFLLVGLDSENTGILDKSKYKNSLIIQDNIMFQTNGKFDEAKFDRAYEQALYQYNDFTRLSQAEKPFFRDDIFAPKELRNNNEEFKILKVANPLRLKQSFSNFGVKEDPTKSVREIAESNPVFDYKTGKWVESPNETWVNNFINPKVLAQWDFDADENGNPTNDADKIVYHKGDKKIDPTTGTYYYETLGGRDIYGREVLSGFDTLTTDGSAFNKYDFFDSDDREKSFGGSLTRAVAQIAPVFIPYVGEVYVGTRIILSMALLLPTIGKIFTGSDNSFLSLIEGINKALTFSTSDATLGSSEAGIEANPWTMETGLKLISDVFTQLAEQRWLFKYGNALFSWVNPKLIGQTEEAEATRKLWIESNAAKQGFSLELLVNKSRTPLDLIKAADMERAVNYLRAKTTLDKTLKSGQELSKHLSMAYMTGITTADSYGEAKLLGASDIEAALFALGYTAGEYALLSSDLGQWILPELKMEKFQNRQIAKALSKVTREAGNVNEPTGLARQKWYKSLVNYGKLLAKQDYSDSVLTNASKMTASSMLSEGVEETSEELLLDFSKTIFNAFNALRGDETKFDDAWLDMATRYGMSFIGGTVGGGIATALPGYKAARTWLKEKINDAYSNSEAYKLLVNIVLNGQSKEFINTVNKMTLGNKDLSTVFEENSDGTISYKPAEKYEDSLDYILKQKLIELVNLIENILNSEGAKISDDSLLNDKLIRKELKYYSLLNSNVLGIYTNDFNNLLSDLVTVSKKVNELEAAKSGTDSNKTDGLNNESKKSFGNNEQQELKDLKAKLKELREKLEAYKNGSMANEFIGEALFEMDSHISDVAYASTDRQRWIESESKKKLEELNPSELAKYNEKWEEAKLLRRETVHRGYLVFKLNQEVLSDILKNHEELYFVDNKENVFRNLEEIFLNGDEKRISESGNPTVEASKWIPIETRKLIWNNLLNSLKGSISEEEYNKLSNGINISEKYELYIGLQQLPLTIEELNSLSPEIKQKLLEDLKAEEEPLLDSELLSLIETRKKEFNDEKAENFVSGWSIFISSPLVLKEFINKLKEAKYLTPTTKLYIRDFINRADVTEDTIKELNTTLDSINSSPVEELLSNMKATLLSAGIDTTGMITDLSKFMSDLANSVNIENFSYSEELDLKIRKTLDLIDIAHSHIEAAKTEIYGDLNNFFGYNATINELREKYPVEGLSSNPLVQLKASTADSLMHELAKIYNDLKFYLAIYNANTNSKLTDHIKVELKLNTIYFNNIKNWSIEIPDDWKDKDKIINAVNNASTTLGIIDNNKNSITSEERTLMFGERLNIEQAIYEFFLSNKDKLNSNELYRLFTNLNFISGKSSLLNSGVEYQDDLDFMWYIASLAANNPSAVLNEYNNSITGKYAPIIALEEAIRRAYSYILNPKVFEIFGETYNNIYKEQLIELRKKTGDTRTDFDTDEYLIGMRHFLIEGIPGSGKTSATFTMLHNMLKLYHPELLNKVWFVSNSKQNATNASSEIGIEGVTVMSKEEYFNRISINYKQNYDNYGAIQLDINDVEQDENGINHYKDVLLNSELEAPTLVFFDEVSSFSQQDLLLSEDFLKTKGAYAFAAGDFDLIGALGLFQDNDDKTIFVRLNSSNFISSWKLGSSMRSNNTYKSKNIAVIRESLKNFYLKIGSFQDHSTSPNTPIKLSYYEAFVGHNKGLFGDKVIRTEDIKEWEKSVKNMLDSLDEGEILNYIFDDPSTDLYQTLKLLNDGGLYKDKINFITAGASQGLEGLYYIIELNSSFDKTVEKTIPYIDGKLDASDETSKNFGKTLYTAISRAKQGSLIIGNYDNDLDYPLLLSVYLDTLLVNNLSPQILLNFANERKDIISSVLKDVDVKTPPPVREAIKEPEIKHNTESGENPSGDDITEENVINSNMDRPNLINNTEEGKLNLMMHSFMCQETGCETISGKEPTDPGTELKLGRYFEKRIDNLNGLALIDKRSEGKIVIPGVEIDKDGVIIEGKENLLTILNRIRNLSCYTKDKNKLIEDILKELGTSTPLKVSFAYKNQYRSYKSEEETLQWFDLNPEYLKFYKGKDESLAGIFNESNDSPKIREPKDLVIEVIISLLDGTLLLEVPLCKITSPLTLLNTSEFEGLKLVFDSVGLDISEFKKEIKKLLQLGSNIPHIKEYAMLLELYEGSAFNTISYFSKDFTLAKVAKVTGITTTSTERGKEYFKTLEYYYDGKWMSLEEYLKRMPWRKMSKIFTSVLLGTQVVSVNGREIEVGKPFVLVSDYYSDSISDNQLLEYYLQQLNDPNSQPLIRLVYVTPPQATLEEYIFNLNNALTKHKNNIAEVDRDLGTKVSAFRLLLFALDKNSNFREAFLNWVESSPQSNKEDFISRLEAVSNIVSTLSLLEYNEGNKKLFEILNTPIRSLPANLKELLKYSDSTGDKWLMNVSSNLTFRHVLLQELHKMLLSDLFYGDSLLSNLLHKQNDTIVFPDKVQSKVLAFIEDAKKGGWNGVLYHLKLKNDSQNFDKYNLNITIGSQSLLFAEIDTEYGLDYSVSGKPIQINGKLDATSFILDIVPFAKWIIKGGLGRNPDTISSDTSSNIFADSDSDSNLKRINTARYLGKDTSKETTSENKTFSDILNNAKFPNGLKSKTIKLLSEIFNNIENNSEKLEIIKDSREFIYKNSGFISHIVNGELKIFNFGNIKNIIFLDSNVLFLLEDDISKVYKLDVDGKALPISKEEFIQTIQNLKPSKTIAELAKAFPEENHPLIDPNINGEELIQQAYDLLLSNGIISEQERQSININSGILLLTNPRKLTAIGALQNIFIKNPNTGKFEFKDPALGPKLAALIALLGLSKYNKIMDNPDLQGIINLIDKNLENYIFNKMQERENDSCSFSRFGI